MRDEFPYAVFLSHSAKDKAVVRTSSLSASNGERAGVRCRSPRFAERLRADGVLNNSQLSTNSQPVEHGAPLPSPCGSTRLHEPVLKLAVGDKFTNNPNHEQRAGFMNAKTPLIQPEQIEHAILLIRGQRVMLDRELAALYGVETKNLNKAVQRNRDRFPADFMFQLTADEADGSRFQFGTLKRGQNIKYLPHVFTQEGVAMLSSVLRSPRAIQVNIAIMRVFVRFRETLALHRELAHKLAELERKIEGHDTSIRTLFDAIRELAVPPAKPRREIGFHVKEDSAPYRVKRK